MKPQMWSKYSSRSEHQSVFSYLRKHLKREVQKTVPLVSLRNEKVGWFYLRRDLWGFSLNFFLLIFKGDL